MAKTIKTYFSGSELSLSIQIGEAKTQNAYGVAYTQPIYRRVVFEADTMNRCTYKTAEEAVQKALEAHPWFDVKFGLEKTEEVSEKTGTETKTKSKSTKKTEVKKVEVASASDAKQYLVEKFEISRTQIQTVSDIKKFAAQNNIEFVGL